MPEKNSSGGAGTSAGGCVDQDGDGFGDNCSAGRDCNDFDPLATDQCFGACSSPSQGCECDGEAPVACFLDQTANADGTIMCHEGTRHCRNGKWGACEDVHSFSVTPRQDTRLLPDVFRRATCSDCEQNCFVAQDYLEPVDAGLLNPYANAQVEQIPAGGITVRRTSDAGVMYADAGPGMYPDGAVPEWPVPDAGPCLVGTDPLDTDCDSIPNYYDSRPNDPSQPFPGPPAHAPIVSTTPNDFAVDVHIDSYEFRLREADIYFLLDVTRNQNVERTAFIDAVNNSGITTPLVNSVSAGEYPGGTYPCLDMDADGNPDDFRKFEGLLGAARCFTGDTHFGVGFVDEVPVRDPCSVPYAGVTVPPPPGALGGLLNLLLGLLGLGGGSPIGGPPGGAWTECHYGDDTLRVPFRNLFDVNPSDAAFQTAVYRLPSIPTRLELPQAGTQALWALATGASGDLYYGPNRPAFGARRDCPAGTYGAACFRDGVLPITFMFSDTGQHNGPNNYIPTGYKPALTANSNPTYAGAPYVANNLALPTSTEWGTPFSTGERAQHVPNTNETLFSPFELGAIDNRRLTLTGSTIGMSADASAASMGVCGAADAAPDAFIAFNLANASSVTISTTGTVFDSEGTSSATPASFSRVVSLFPSVSAATTTPITMMTTPLGNITNGSRLLSGDSSDGANFGNGYLGSVSHCGADGSTGEAHVTFTAPGRQIVGSFSGGGSQAVMDIYNGLPPANPVPTAVAGTNDTFATAHVINAAGDPGYVSFTGNTNDVALANDYVASMLPCGATSNTANDALFRFHVDGPRRVRIDTEGSAIDTVISLHDAPPITPNTIAVDNIQADSATGWSMGLAENAVTTLDGDSTGAIVPGDFLAASGTATDGTTCTPTTSAAPDHLVSFTLTTPTVIRAQELGGGSNPPVAIYTNVMPSTGYSANNDTGFGTTGVSVGTAYDMNVPAVGGIASRVIQLTGLTTTGKAEDVTSDMFAGCGASAPAAGANDVVYKFRSPVAITGATFRLEGQGATRPMMALFDTAGIAYTPVAGNELHASAQSVTLGTTGVQLFSGNTAAMGNAYSEWGLSATGLGCNMTAGAPDAIYRIINPSLQGVTFRASSTTGHDPVLRLFPHQGAGTPATPWTKNSTALAGAASDTYLNANLNVFTVTGQTTRRDGNFGAAGFNDNSDNGCASDNASRDAFYRINLTTRTTVWLHANGSDEVTMAVYPGTNTTFTAANYATDYLGATVPCDQGGNDVYRTVTLNAGTYYVVVKSRYKCGILGCLFSAWGRSDKAFYLEAFDATTQTPLIATTVPQAQLACDDDSGGGTISQLNYANLPAGTYDLMVTSQGAGGGYRLSAGPGSLPAPAVCSTSTMPAGQTASGTSAAAADTIANANANPIAVQNAWIRKNGDLGVGTWNDNSDTCAGSSNARDAFFRLDVTRRSHLLLEADGSSNTDVSLTVVSTAGPNWPANAAFDPVAAANVSCNTGAGLRTLDIWLDPGTYYAVVKAHDSGTDLGCLFAANCHQDDPFHFAVRDVTEQAVQTFTANIAANTDYYLVAKGMNATAGAYNLTIGGAVQPTMCMAPNAVGTTAVAMPAGTHYALLKGDGATGPYSFQIGETLAALDSRIACDNDSGPGSTSMIEYNLPAAGDYYVVVKGAAAAQEGAYRLNLRDMTNVTDNWVGCANHTTNASFTTPALGAGPYTAIIKGSEGTEGPFAATIYDQAIGVASNCSNGAPYTVALPAGRHVVGIKGTTTTNTGRGAYQVTVAAGTPPNATAAERAFVSKTWGDARNAVTAAGMKVVPMQSCEPGTDWGTGAGNPTPGNTTTNPTGTFSVCGTMYGGPLGFVMGILGAVASIPLIGPLLCGLFNFLGFIFAALGLVTSSAVTTSTTTIINNPVTGCATDGAGVATAVPENDANALYGRLQNPSNIPLPRGAWPQSREIARAVGTVYPTDYPVTSLQGQPMAFWLRESPTSDTVALQVARALYALTEGLRMDVSMEIEWDATTTPGYVVSIDAINPTDCISAVGATHRDCAPGDKPEFQVQFLNPGMAPVAQNPDPGSNGAWPGRLVIYGDDRFVLDEIPVFLIPPLQSMMLPPPPPPRYSGMPAVYYQDIGTRECDGTLLPDWTDLYFNAEMPPGTQIRFRACAANDQADLATCTLQDVATVFATNTPCFSDAACRGLGGFCGSGGPDYLGGYCQVITPHKQKGLCSSEPECPDGPANGITPYDLLSDCVTGVCDYDSQPADVGRALGATNFSRWSRMQMSLEPNDGTLAGYPPANTYAPNLLDWAVTYVCTPAQ